MLLLALGFPALAWAMRPPTTPRSYDVEEFDLSAIEEAARSGRAVSLEFFGETHPLVLRESVLRSPRFRATAGSLAALRTIYPSRPELLQGSVAGDPSSVVRLSIGPRGLRGLIKSGGDAGERWVFIEPVEAQAKARNGGRIAHKVFTEADLDWNLEMHCAAPLAADLPSAAERGELAPGGPVPAGATAEAGELRIFEIAVDADVEYSRAYGDGAPQEIESTLNIVDGIYEAELGLKLSLVSLRVWESEPDPYGSADSGALLDELRGYWNSHCADISRDAVHLFTGKELSGNTVGIAYVSVVCASSYGYGLSQDLGSDVLTPLVVAHEVGHNLGASHDPTGSSPMYIMYPSLSGSTLDEFSANSKEEIGRYVASVSCLAVADAPDPPPPDGGNEPVPHKGGGGGPVDPLLVGILGFLCFTVKRHSTRSCHGK